MPGLLHAIQEGFLEKVTFDRDLEEEIFLEAGS